MKQEENLENRNRRERSGVSYVLNNRKTRKKLSFQWHFKHPYQQSFKLIKVGKVTLLFVNYILPFDEPAIQRFSLQRTDLTSQPRLS